MWTTEFGEYRHLIYSRTAAYSQPIAQNLQRQNVDMFSCSRSGEANVRAQPLRCVRSMTSCSNSARASLTDNGENLVIANPSSGFTLYSLKTGHLIRAFGHDVGQERATPVKFIESGTAIVGGTTVGAVNIWDVATGRKLQTLLHTGEFARSMGRKISSLTS